jgi:hypothetical protein
MTDDARSRSPPAPLTQLRLPAPCRIHQVDESVDDETVLHLAYAEQVGPRPAFIAPDHRDNLAIELSDPAVWRQPAMSSLIARTS